MEKLIIGKLSYDIPKIWRVNRPDTWPPITYDFIYEYLINSKAFDNRAMQAFKATYADNYVYSGWLGDINSYCDNNKGCHILNAKVSPSQPTGKSMEYMAFVVVEQSGEILNATCTCPAGKGRACSHAAAIMYAVYLAWHNNLAGESCTDIPVTWGKGKRDVGPAELEDISFKKKKTGELPIETFQREKTLLQKCPPIRQFYGQDEMVEFYMTSPIKDLVNIPNTIFYDTLHAKVGEVEVENETQNIKSHGPHDADYSCPISNLSCNLCWDFYSRYIIVPEGVREELCEATVKQGGSDLWMDCRKIRLSASVVSQVPKTARGSASKFVERHLNPTFKGNFHTARGHQLEPIARSTYQNTRGQNVTESGLVISKEDNWLAASPDGLCGDVLLEIKCPGKDLEDLIKSNKYDVRKNSDQDLYLYSKGPRGYYYQIQVGMYCTNLKLSHLYLWTGENETNCETATVIVNYDEDFMNGLLPRLRRFYFGELLPAIVDRAGMNQIKFSQEFLEFFR